LTKRKKNRFFKKPDSHSKTEIENTAPEKTQNESVYEAPPSRSWLTTGTKYAYIIAAAALLSGVFTPFTIGEEINTVILGMLITFTALAGGVLIFKGIKQIKPSSISVLIGLSLMIISLILIYILANESFGAFKL